MHRVTNNKFIVHLILDEKFIDMALREFEAVAPEQNIAIFLGKKHTLKFVKNKNILFIHRRSQIKKIVCSGKCAAVIFHSLHNNFLPTLKVIPRHIKKIWLGWGFDYYDRLLSIAFHKGLYLEETKSLMKKIPLATLIRKVVRRIKINILFDTNNLLNQIDYFIPVLDVEYELAIKLNPWFKTKYICWNYGTVEHDFLFDGSEHDVGEDILVGNSSSFTNNHIDTFNLLRNKFDIGERKILVPLSYGDKWYRDQVIQEGTRLFGGNFIPIVDFLPKNEYIDLLNRCGYVFMNHLRQQALGNICIMMLKGARIYLNTENPLYRWFLNKGGFIDIVNDQTNNNKKKILKPMISTQRKKNIDIIMRHWGADVQRAKTRHLVDIALDRNN